MITAEAGVNLAAVHYHFGSKEELLRAILRRHVEPINERRLGLLDAAIARADGKPPPLDEILEAFLRPAIEYIHGGRRTHLMRLVAMLHSNPELLPAGFFHEIFDTVIQRFRVLERALPHLQADEIVWRFHFMIGAMMQCVSDVAAKNDPRLLKPDVSAEEMLQRLLSFVKAGFEAPATSAEGEGNGGGYRSRPLNRGAKS
jgi:AcrR family transcriptional regulator